MILRFCYLAALIVTISGFAFSQSPAKLVDKGGDVGCELFLALFEQFMSTIHNDPQATGYLVIYGGQGDLAKRLTYESWAGGNILSRRFPKDRIRVVHGEDTGGQFKIEFWAVPNGAPKPFEEAKLSYVLPEKTRPFIFDSEDFAEGCPSSKRVFYRELLKANPKARGNIVIEARTRKRFDQKQRDIVKEFGGKDGVAQNRLRFYFVRERRRWCHPDPCVEYWIVP